MTPFLVHQLLSESARRNPQRPAVAAGGAVLTYGELDERSSRLAGFLRASGVAVGARVGIHLEKSLEAVIAIFGALKAGAAYVPVDPRAPASRAAYIVGNADMHALIASGDRLARLRPLLDKVPPVLVVAGGGAEGATAWDDALAAPVLQEGPGVIDQDLAYILYTSGSTGEPKGVMISHRAALTFVNWAVDYFGLHADDRLANHAPLHFDLSTFDIFGAMAAGASVALVPPAATVFPRNLADWIAATGITVWYSVPSALVQLAVSGGLERHDFGALRLVLFAGEVFPVRHLRTLMQQIPHAAYFNLYGPTETNVCTVYAVRDMPAEDAPPLPIGRACANTGVFALDDEGQLVGPGGTGELHVCGSILMRGYWGRPELTAKALLPNPLGGGRPEKVYRTGDLVRLDENGDWHFIGRRDLQVKSRGYRIELGDVEAVLNRHSAVAEAVVVPVPHDEFGCTLKGIVVARPGSEVKRAQLAAFCAEHLPPYMVPADFEVRETLPRTSSGKVDRRSLV